MEQMAVEVSPAANMTAFFHGAATRIEVLSVTTDQNGMALISCRAPGG